MSKKILLRLCFQEKSEKLVNALADLKGKEALKIVKDSVSAGEEPLKIMLLNDFDVDIILLTVSSSDISHFEQSKIIINPLESLSS